MGVPEWCVVRTSLFHKDFNVDSCSEDEQNLFKASLAFTTSGLDLSKPASGSAARNTLKLFENRARYRSGPRGLFAAAALALPNGVQASLADVSVEISESRECHRQEGVIESESADASKPLRVSPNAVFHGGGVTLYRYNKGDGDFDRLKLSIPDTIVAVLQQFTFGTEATWAQHFKDANLRDPNIISALKGIGILCLRQNALIWNGAE